MANSTAAATTAAFTNSHEAKYLCHLCCVTWVWAIVCAICAVPFALELSVCASCAVSHESEAKCLCHLCCGTCVGADCLCYLCRVICVWANCVCHLCCVCTIRVCRLCRVCRQSSGPTVRATTGGTDSWSTKTLTTAHKICGSLNVDMVVVWVVVDVCCRPTVCATTGGTDSCSTKT